MAPAGSGKSTLLAQFAAAAEAPVAWYRAQGSDVAERDVLRCLHTALSVALGPLQDGWQTADDAIASLELVERPPAVLIVDDLHLLRGTASEELIERFANEAPDWLSVLAASRGIPDFNLSRLRVAGHLLEISADDLRFRTWEVESLYRDFYEEPLAPEDTATLARRTEGWAAALQLFHLATRGKSAKERRQTLESMTRGSRLIAEYLTRNVLQDLPEELRRFLLETSVLGRLSAEVCDKLLSDNGGREALAELERRQILTSRIDDTGWYRYHEVLRSHLEVTLLDEIGESALRGRHRRAGEVLEEANAPTESLQAYCRAEEWEAASRLLSESGGEMLDAPSRWIDRIPSHIVQTDPWLLLGSARTLRNAGRWKDAIDAYRRAERKFLSEAGRRLCHDERTAMARWFESPLRSTQGWDGSIRAAVVSVSERATRSIAVPAGPNDRFANAIHTLLAGNFATARSLLMDVVDDPDAEMPVVVGAMLADAVAATMLGESSARLTAERAREEAARIDIPWLENIGRVLAALGGSAEDRLEVERVRNRMQEAGDPWGVALVSLLDGLDRLRGGEAPVSLLEGAAGAFHDLGAGTLEAWSRCASALATVRCDDPAATQILDRAESFARAMGLHAPRAFTTLGWALIASRSNSGHATKLQGSPETLYFELLPGLLSTSSEQDEIHHLTIRCFGSFTISIDDRVLHLGVIRPRARALLRLLALHKGRAVHREILCASLWPEADPVAGLRNLQVAVSAVRRALQPGTSSGSSAMILRQGETYQLALPPGSTHDLIEFDQLMRLARTASEQHDFDSAKGALERALELQADGLLLDDGPAEWVVGERDHYRAMGVEAARMLASLLGETSPARAIAFCRRALKLDPYDDAVWRTLMGLYEASGDKAAAARARSEYSRVLSELGIDGLNVEDLGTPGSASVGTGG